MPAGNGGTAGQGGGVAAGGSGGQGGQGGAGGGGQTITETVGVGNWSTEVAVSSAGPEAGYIYVTTPGAIRCR